jgi:hypothetical protein
MLYLLNTIDNNIAPTLQQPAIGVAVNPFFVEMMIPFSCLNAFPDDYTIFNSKKLKDQNNEQFDLEIALGTVADVISAGTAVLQNITARVNAMILENEPSNIYRPLNSETMRANRTVLTGIGVFKSAFDLKTGNKLKRVAILVEDGSDLNSDVTIDEIRLRKGTQTYVQQWKWLQLKDDMKKLYGLATVPEGFAVIEIDRNLDFSNMLDTKLEDQVYLEVDTFATSKVSVLAQEILE